MQQKRKQPKEKITWETGSRETDYLKSAYTAFLAQLPGVNKEHIAETPTRIVRQLCELTNGYTADPVAILKTRFSSGNYNQMISVGPVPFASLCSHHVLPFTGFYYFAYIPNKKIVGLSKIPRMFEVFSHRLQVQEDLSEQVVDCFQRIVKPKGCAVLVEAQHMCMSLRGVKKSGFMRTTALRGIFLTDESAKAEFLASVRK